jgi:UDP-N-acetylglucosamine 4,6-dehydratase/5-epimerase
MMREGRLMITGGSGTFGNAVLHRYLSRGSAEVRIFSRDEKKQDDMRRRWADPRIKFYIGDVRNEQSVKDAMAGVEFVFHAAALKQVPSCEFFPMEAIRTNALGAENVLNAAIAAGVQRVVVLSTDKAVYPINAMGISKGVVEKVGGGKARVAGRNTNICCTRYGNVMASRGSVVPLFIRQIQGGQPITITDPRMTRFMMSVDGAVDLVLFAFEHGNPGDIFVQKAPAATLDTLAVALKKVLNADNAVRVIGTRHGEKLYETLLTREEFAVAEDMGGYYRVPADNRDLNYGLFFEEGRQEVSAKDDYSSNNTHRLSVDEMAGMLLELDVVQRARAGERVEV